MRVGCLAVVFIPEWAPRLRNFFMLNSTRVPVGHAINIHVLKYIKTVKTFISITNITCDPSKYTMSYYRTLLKIESVKQTG